MRLGLASVAPSPVKFPLPFVFCLLFARLTLSVSAGDGIVDLTNLANYANQTVPAYINPAKNNTPANNPITNKGATLGRILFYDKRLSRTDTISCASCHQQAHGFSDAATASTGVAGTTGRHAMRLINARFANEAHFFWDERALTLEAQTSQPIQNHVEMGFSGTLGDPAFSGLVTKLSAISDYRVLFTFFFGDATITEARVQSVLAQFVRSIQSFDSRFDEGRAAAPDNATDFLKFSDSENRGKTLFLRPPNQNGAGCAGCHQPPEFDIDPNSRNNGVITAIGGLTDDTNTRAPSLRDLLGPGGVPNGGFMHDGSRATLADVIAHYNLVPNNATLDNRLRGPGGNLGLLPQERTDLINFLATLTGTAVYTDARWSDPFNAQGQLSLIVLSAPVIAMQSGSSSVALITAKAAVGFSYVLQSSPDLKTWTNVSSVTPNASGVCTQPVTVTGKNFYRYAYEPPAAIAALAATTAPSTSSLTATSRSRTVRVKRTR